MEFLQAYLGAIGGTATLLVIVGFFGKSIIQQWLKKDYKEWESELEERLREDFKRFEIKLDRLSAREGIRYDFNFKRRAEAIIEIQTISRSVERRLNRYIGADDFADAEKALLESRHRIERYKVYVSEQAQFFPPTVVTKLQQSCRSASKIIDMREANEESEQIDSELSKFADELNDLEKTFRDLLGAHILEEDASNPNSI